MWTLSYRIEEVGGPVASTPELFDEGGSIVRHGLASLAAPGEGLTFVLHGYNTGRDEGLANERGFVADLQAQVPALAQSQFVGVLWPGDSIVGFLSYPTEEADADRTALAFARTLWGASLSTPPHFVAHSLGCRVLLRTLDILATWDSGRAWAEQVVLLAGAVDNDVLAQEERYLDAVRTAARVVNVASSEDQVLKWGFTTGDFLAGLFSSGGYTRTALGRFGPASRPPAPAKVRAIQLGSREKVGHKHYLGNSDPLKRQRISKLAGHAITLQEPLTYWNDQP